MVNDEVKLENPNSVKVVLRLVDGPNFGSAVTYISKSTYRTFGIERRQCIYN